MSETFLPGALVALRGREWVVLGHEGPEVLRVRPIGGLEEEETCVHVGIEDVRSSTFPAPSAGDLGDYAACRLLRDAALLSTRASAGPFRSFGRIAVEPRPYQLVPLLMALKLDPVRLLIADDVGIGKTIETCLILRELIDRGEVKRFSVLCPPHLAEQWTLELETKFHIEATLVMSDTIQRLERRLPTGTSVFDRHPFTIVSTDMIKGRGRRDDFIAKCPPFVIVDEAHACAPASAGGNHQRYELVRQLTADPARHVVLVTATPHSGNEDAFRSLLGLLDQEFADLPLELERATRDAIRTKLAKHLVQRRRVDIQKYLDVDTSFPQRLSRDLPYTFTPEFRLLFDDVLAYVRDYVAEGEQIQRGGLARYWSALSLLRCLSSSPAAAIATLKNRAEGAEAAERIDQEGQRVVLDADDVEDSGVVDVVFAGSAAEDSPDMQSRQEGLVKRLEGFLGEKDMKLRGILKELRTLLQEGKRPIVFCRFIHTAEYLKEEFRLRGLGKGVEVESVTGLLPGVEREERIARLSAHEAYVLVATNCISEGINLQNEFDTVIHYDLSWNPTVHEQREGRVDRFGQPRSQVHVITYFGENNPIDGAVLQVLLRKHEQIKSDLGVSVSIPGNSQALTKTLFEHLLFRNAQLSSQLPLVWEPDEATVQRQQEWEDRSRLEKESRTVFAQRSLSPELVQQELAEVQQAIGSAQTVRRFVEAALPRFGSRLTKSGQGVEVHIDSHTPRALRQAINSESTLLGKWELPLERGQTYFGRTSPFVEGLASFVLEQALDKAAREGTSNLVARLGVIRSNQVAEVHHVFVLRQRYQLMLRHGEAPLLAEEILTWAFKGSPENPNWLEADAAAGLLEVRPTADLPAAVVDQQRTLLASLAANVQQQLDPRVEARAAEVLRSHERVREASKVARKVSIVAVRPTDVLGVYKILPA